MEEEFDLIDMIKYFWNKKMRILIVGIICVLLAVIYTGFLVTPKYSATSKFILTNVKFETEGDIYAYAKLPDRYYTVAESRVVLDKVINNLKLDVEDALEFKEKCIEIVHSPASFFITVTVNTEDAKMSANIANEIVKVTIEEIKEIYRDNDVKVLDYAIENWEPININYLENIIKFILIGEIIICGYILIIYVYRDRINEKEK